MIDGEVITKASVSGAEQRDFEMPFEPLHVVPTVREVTTSAWDSMSDRARRKNNSSANDATGMYLDAMGTHPLLKKEHEQALAMIIENGQDAISKMIALGLDYETADPSVRRLVRQGVLAKQQFLLSNLRLVVSIAKHVKLPPGMELLDLVQEGNLGLEHAIEKFDWRKGFKFSTYATFWIRQAINRGIDSRGTTIKLPGDLGARMRAELRANGGEVDDLSESSAAAHRAAYPASLNKPISEDGQAELGDLLEGDLPDPETEAINGLDNLAVVHLLERLEDENPQAAQALRSRFGFEDGEPKSYARIGRDLDVNSATASNRVKRGLELLRVLAGEFEIETR